MNKKVYIGMSADMIRPRHLNIIKEVNKLSDIIIGLLTNNAIVNYKCLHALKFEQRKMIVRIIKGSIK